MVGAKWDGDLEKKIWTIPADRMKAGVEPRGSLPRYPPIKYYPSSGRSRKNFVFKTGKKDVAMSTMSIAMLLRHEKTDITVHGMRASYSDRGPEEYNLPIEGVRASSRPSTSRPRRRIPSQ